MQPLEARIAAWRSHLEAALPGQNETVDELEAHLRDHLERALAAGISPEKAFADGVSRLGETRKLAHEFNLVAQPVTRCWPPLLIHSLVGLPALAAMVLIALEVRGGAVSLLRGTHGALIILGYLTALGTGLVGIWTVVSLLARSATDRDLRLQQRALLRFLVIGSISLSIGIALGMIWAHEHLPTGAWSWQSEETGTLAVLVSTGMLLLLQGRAIRSHVLRTVIALSGALVIFAAWMGADARLPVPIAWLSLSAVFAQGATALLHVRRLRLEKVPLRSDA